MGTKCKHYIDNKAPTIDIKMINNFISYLLEKYGAEQWSNTLLFMQCSGMFPLDRMELGIT